MSHKMEIMTMMPFSNWGTRPLLNHVFFCLFVSLFLFFVFFNFSLVQVNKYIVKNALPLWFALLILYSEMLS